LADFCRNAITPRAAGFYPVRPGKNLRDPGGVDFTGQLSREVVVDLVYIEISTRSYSSQRPLYSHFFDKSFRSYRASCKSLLSIFSPSYLYSVIHNATESALSVFRSVSLIYLRGYTSDNLPFLPSDSAQSFPSNALYGEPSDYITDIVFSHPRSVSQPEILERVGSLRRKNFALWTEMVNNEFVEWWLKTELGSRINRNLFEDKCGARTAECWKHFHQVAAISDGEPRVMCKTCDHTLSHPADGHPETSSMNKH
jgi:hypothetical protein